MTAPAPDASSTDPRPDWHALTAAEVVARLGSGDDGLSGDEVARRRRRYGPNELAEQPTTPWPVVLVRQIRSPLIYILIAAVGVMLLLGEFLDAAVVATAVVINTVVGFFQERKAEQAVRALTALVVPQARVVRDRREREVDSRRLVPGDLVLLEPGVRVPADLRLVRVAGLEVDESLLTGESRPVAKTADPVPADAVLADRRSMAYTGSTVTSGRARGVVVATGGDTELGAVADLIRGEPVVRSPLQDRLDRFARLILLAVAVSAVVAFGTGLALGGGVREMFMVAVALSVAAVPEGLPVAVTVALALGVHRMARRRAIIRRLPAVETLGSTTVIGSDKTGTLTENRMTVQRVWAGGRAGPVEGPAAPGTPVYEVLRAGSLTNEAEAYATDDGLHTSGDPTDVALLTAAMAAGLVPDELREDHPVLAEVPFEPERRYSATVRRVDDEVMVFAKGAPERILDMCDRMLDAAGSVVPVDRSEVLDAAHRLAADGLRVIATAHRRLAHPSADPEQDGGLENMVLLGLVGMMDPPREGVAEAIGATRRAGIRVVMITGDHAATARAIADRLGIGGPDRPVLTGADLAAMDDDRLQRAVAEVDVFARTSPEDKLRIVHALQRRGEIVAVTGDGVNDAPALKAAAIGVAMGRDGTDVAREAADMVLTDDNFVSIADATTLGRVTFDNICKVSFFLVSTGAATILAILMALWAGWPLVMLPAQLLWLNLVTNGVQDLALAFEPAEEGVQRRPPRPPGEGVLSVVLWWRTALVGVVMAAGTLVMFDWALQATGSLPEARTVALTTMVVFQAFHLANVRSETRSVFRVGLWSNRLLAVGASVALGVHVVSLYLPPTQLLLRVEPIGLDAWVRIVAVAVSVVVVVEIEKLARRWWDRRAPRRAAAGYRRDSVGG